MAFAAPVCVYTKRKKNDTKQEEERHEAGGSGASGGSAVSVSYDYDHNGLRTRKQVTEKGVTTSTEYRLHGKRVTHLTQKAAGDVAAEELHFYYDAEGRPEMVDWNGTVYTYLHNVQGDVTGIVDNTGSIVVEYKYDAWGYPIGTSGTLTTTLGALNPFRYRGYVYDEETGLYYLRSRYYNPNWGRFISPDMMMGRIGKLLSHNVFAYCRNNSVNCVDSDGREGRKKLYLYYDSEGNYLKYIWTRARFTSDELESIKTVVDVADGVVTVINLGKGIAKLASKGIAVSAKQIVKKGPRRIKMDIKRYEKELGEFMNSQLRPSISDIMSMSPGELAVAHLARMEVQESVPYDPDIVPEILVGEEVDIIELELKPYPSRYFIDESLYAGDYYDSIDN